jgi:hypothetical protein
MDLHDALSSVRRILNVTVPLIYSFDTVRFMRFVSFTVAIEKETPRA